MTIVRIYDELGEVTTRRAYFVSAFWAGRYARTVCQMHETVSTVEFEELDGSVHAMTRTQVLEVP